MNDDVFILAAILAAAVCAAVIKFTPDSRDETIQLETKVANLEAELQAKDATVAMYRQLLDAKQREIELQKAIISKLEQQIKGDN